MLLNGVQQKKYSFQLVLLLFFPFCQIKVFCCIYIQDDITGDGTTSNVLIIGELLKQADLYISEVFLQFIVSVLTLGDEGLSSI